MARPADKVFNLLKEAKGPGDVFSALTADPMLMIGIVVIVAIILLFLRIYLWPKINPFNYTWFSDFWNWITTPYVPPPPGGKYPYAKVIYPTYR